MNRPHPLERLLALALLVVLSPVLLSLAFVVRIRLGSPVLFRQRRAGLMGRPFWLVKFRSMNDRRDADGRLRPDAQRLTSFGRWLRSSSLDELPELFNILRGEMCFVGPRPLLMEYLPLYSPEQARRHTVKPGLTGWAQIHGRNALSWEERFRLDVWYVDHHSFGLDLRILWLTMAKVLRREGISAAGEATMAPFSGSEPPDQP
jgi:lipopolysaccharide/colanic/teichoic acid biosynthesis glycosyltransferase